MNLITKWYIEIRLRWMGVKKNKINWTNKSRMHYFNAYSVYSYIREDQFVYMSDPDWKTLKIWVSYINSSHGLFISTHQTKRGHIKCGIARKFHRA